MNPTPKRPAAGTGGDTARRTSTAPGGRTAGPRRRVHPPAPPQDDTSGEVAVDRSEHIEEDHAEQGGPIGQVAPVDTTSQGQRTSDMEVKGADTASAQAAVGEDRPVSRRDRRVPVADVGWEPGAAPSRSERVGVALRTWRGELAETGGPNALLWYRDSIDGALDLTKAHPTGLSMLMAGNVVRLSHLVRESAAFRDVLVTARRIRAKSLELWEEHGISSTYVCVGMATWELPGTLRCPQAPIMLRSVRLHAVDAGETDVELELSSRIEINPVLMHYMSSEQGVRLDGDALAELAHSTGRFDPLPVYRELRRLLVQVPGFTIDDRRVLSTFALGKMAMVADLAAFAGMASANDVVAALAGDPGGREALRSDGASGLADRARRPAEPDLSRELLVLDADPRQAEVVDAARSGHHVVVDAPRGSGATQTLVNVAAALVGNDQRVLVISESARQLDDFTKYLDKAGLSELLLDARDPQELRRTLARRVVERIDAHDEAYDLRSVPENGRQPTRFRFTDATENPRADTDTPEAALSRTRGRLAAHVDSLHTRRQPWNVSVFDAQTALAVLSARENAPTSRIRIAPAPLHQLTRPTMERFAAEAAEVAAEGAWTAKGADDPWWGVRFPGVGDYERGLVLVRQLAKRRLAEDRDALNATLSAAGLPPAHTVEDWGVALELIADVRETLSDYRHEIFSTPLQPLIAATSPNNDGHARWWTRSVGKKTARSLVLPHARIDSLHEGMIRAQDQVDRWSALSGRDAEPCVPEGYDDACSRWDSLVADLHWLDQALVGSRQGGGLLTQPLDEVHQRLIRLTEQGNRVRVLPKTAERLDRLTSAGLGELLDDLACRKVPVDRVAAEVEFVWWLSLLDHIAREDSAYGQHDGAGLRSLSRHFADNDRALLAGRAAHVLDRARAHARVEASTRPDQVTVLRAAVDEEQPRPIRTLLAETGEVAAAAAPIWVMSPLTVASVVPTHLAFDVVLIDDAGRLPLSHAISALTRAAHVVAVGDLRCLEPMQFDTLATGETYLPEADGQGLASVLTELATLLPPRRLDRVYGDRDAQLVSFAHARRDEPVEVWPNAGRSVPVRLLRTGVVLSSADDEGQAAEGRENSRVVELVVEHARRRPGDSIAVVALSPEQAQALDRDIRYAFTQDAQAASAACLVEKHPERLLITTVDDAAGHSRDTVVLASGLVPGADGQMHLPERLVRDDGDRVVDTVVNMARHRLDIVTAVTPADMARVADGGPGQRRLAELLAYAEQGGSSGGCAAIGPAPASTSGASPSGQEKPEDVKDQAAESADEPEEKTDERTAEERLQLAGRHALITELATRLRTEGLTVHEGFGFGRMRLDLVVEDPHRPGNMAVAVISDGDRTAAVPTVRERERLIPEQLALRGWRCVRVWSTDIFRDPARDVARIVEIVRE
ncbi:hypothetical protein [Austwickia chelonae]|uniref:hypothetical protein n=1 Tax=Austwickia chelonae TaxID=100225 RepID=UPI000E24D703|nr:hypothetical protein [Austwickia chelonae]